MKQVTIWVEEYLYEFYKKIGESAEGRTAEKVMSDALFKLAGDLSVDALRNKDKLKKS